MHSDNVGTHFAFSHRHMLYFKPILRSCGEKVWAWKRECVHCVNKLCKTFFFQNSIRILQQCAGLHDQEQEGCWPRLPATLSWMLNLSASDHQVPNLETVCSVEVPGNVVSSWILSSLHPHRVTSEQSQDCDVTILSSDSTQYVCEDI